MDLVCPRWSIPAHPSVLPKQAVHIWRSSLAINPPLLQSLEKLLSADELARSQRFRFPQHQRRFVAGRGRLRQILGRYLDVAPDRLEFHYSPTGKPTLDSAIAGGLQFNLSHSQDLMLCAVSRDRALGIDLEQLRPVSDLEPLTERFFAIAESRRICALPVESRSQAFLQYWTCKEAILKAMGTGLANLSEVELTPIDGALQPIGTALKPWRLQSFIPATEFVAAIAVESDSQPQFAFWQWQDCNSEA